MSWERFKTNVTQKLCDASRVPSIEYVAEVFATEYDLCVKSGGDLVNRIPVVRGNVEAMKQGFIQALRTGLTYTTDYDLTGAMGAGVIAYWTGAILATPAAPLVTPTQIAANAVTNLTANSNTITFTGNWRNTNAGAVQNAQQQQQPPQSQQQQQQQQQQPVRNNLRKVLIVGDSISVNVAGTWSFQFKAARKDLEVEILAIGGRQLTLWMKPELEKRLKSNKYDRVYIFGGVNDAMAAKKATTILNALQSMVNSVNATGAQAVVVTGYDAEKDMDYLKMPITRYISRKEDYIPLLAEYREFQKRINTITGAIIVPKVSVGVLSDGFHPIARQAKILYEHISKF